MVDMKTAIGVRESEMLSEFLEVVARDYLQIVPSRPESIAEQMRAKYAKEMATECRDWAKVVKPVPVGGWK